MGRGKKSAAVKVLQEAPVGDPGGEIARIEDDARVVLGLRRSSRDERVEELVERYRSHPLLSIECTHGTYAEHGEIGAPFKEFLREQFTTLDV